MRTRRTWPVSPDCPDVEVNPTPEERTCPGCGGQRKICDHRFHPIETLEGPLRLVIKLLRCPDRACSTRGQTFSPEVEGTIAPPRWLVDWKLFAWIGHRRYARHWSIPQIREELRDTYSIHLSADVLENYVKRYERMVAARHEDLEQLREVYANIADVVLSIDGIQPEKGHEVLYVVRELNARRVWFAVPVLSSAQDEITGILRRAKEMAAFLGKPVRAWVSDKQEAFVRGIAQVFSGVPHRLCKVHFVRALAKETLEADGHVKVKMRKKVRGLRKVEQNIHEAVLASAKNIPTDLPGSAKAPAALAVADHGQRIPMSSVARNEHVVALVLASHNAVEIEHGTVLQQSGQVVTRAEAVAPVLPSTTASPSPDMQVVLDLCTVTRGILNDSQGTTLDPPGQRMARALEEVKVSIDECLDAKKGGPRTAS